MTMTKHSLNIDNRLKDVDEGLHELARGEWTYTDRSPTVGLFDTMATLHHIWLDMIGNNHDIVNEARVREYGPLWTACATDAVRLVSKYRAESFHSGDTKTVNALVSAKDALNKTIDKADNYILSIEALDAREG